MHCKTYPDLQIIIDYALLSEGLDKSCFIEMVLFSTHNICFV